MAGLYSPSGALNATLSSGLAGQGAYAADGSMNINIVGAVDTYVVSGMIPDSTTTADMTANNTILQATFDALKTGNYWCAVLPVGTYYFSTQLLAEQASLPDFRLFGYGCELVYNSSTVQTVIKIGTTNQSGGTVWLEGFTTRCNMATVRTGGVDHILVRGCNKYYLRNLNIPSANNMAITVGRENGTSTYIPSEVIIEGCNIGGRREAAAHSHGSVGDSGIWIETPGRITIVRGNTIIETGDDGIMLGHNSATDEYRTLLVTGNTLRLCSGGIKALCPGVKIVDNTVDTTLNAGIIVRRDEVQNDGTSARRSIVMLNRVYRAGFFDKANINATSDAGQTVPCAIEVQAPNVWVAYNEVDIVKNSGLILRSLVSAYNVDSFTSLHNTFRRVGASAIDGTLGAFSTSYGAIYRQSGALGIWSNVYSEGDRVVETNCGALVWEANTNTDTNITVVGMVLDNVQIASTTNAPFYFISTSSGKCTNVNLDCLIKANSTIGRPLRASTGSMNRVDFVITCRDEQGKPARFWPKYVNIGANNNHQAMATDEIWARRDATTSGQVTFELDANVSWDITVWVMGDATRSGVKWTGVWNTTTSTFQSTSAASPVYNGGASGYGISYAQNAANAIYATSGKGAVEISSASSAAWAGTATYILKAVPLTGTGVACNLT